MVRQQRRAALRAALGDLRRYRETFSRERLLADSDAQRLVLHAMYVAVQACVDEALQACAAEGIDHDGTYRGAFLALARGGKLEAELAGQMALWAGMRNVLAHFYPVIDLLRIHDALQDIDQLEAFEAWLLTG